ncbi:helix-turn-helix transcriptional regulator [Microbacterium rhizomatis]|uniref:Helix-turn-helix transcriptional regulator n=1 Tax=Microbacterium rhizomatis TaxID=1631477 RepID=A0A5J5J9J0_9MICO|nr:helix-turn-helix transcriptional regulator [Microbacterium rhizomatis]
MAQTGPNEQLDDPAALGRALRVRRRELKLTQIELAELAGVSVRFLSDLERGKASVHLGMVMAVARTLGLRLVAVIPGADR